MNRVSKLSRVVRRALLVSLSTPIVFSSSTQAQEETNQAPERIEVTGSRIKRTDFEGPAPIVTLGAEEIAASGAVNIGDLLNELPALGSTFSLGNSSRFIGTTGLNLLDLRRLGTDRTLVLVDGKRHVASNVGSAAVDINTIPTEWVERVEVITGGASAVYGADAVTGVVNFILKDNIEGLSVRAQKGFADDSDFKTSLLAISGGSDFADGKGNAAFSLEYADQNSLAGTERDQYAISNRLVANPEDGDTAENPNDGIPDEVWRRGVSLHQITEGGVFYVPSSGGPLFGIGQGYVFDPDGSFRIQDLGTNYGGFECQNCDGLDLAKYNELQPEFERIAFNTKLDYRITEDTEFYLNAKYTKISTESFGQPSFDFGFGPFFSSSSYLIQRDNAYVSDALGQLMDDNGLDSISLSRFNNDAGKRIEQVDRETSRIVFGVQGVIDDVWDYDIYANYGQTKATQVNRNNLINERFLASIDAVFDEQGNIVCRSTIDPDSTVSSFAKDGCIPTSIMGDGAVNPEAAAWFNANSITVNKISQANFGATIANSALLELPAGDLGFAAGYEYRKERSHSQPDQLAALGLTFLNALQEERGEYDVNEVFAELRVPVLADLPAIESMTVELAARWADYSTTGSDTSWKVGLDWDVTEDLKARSSVSRAVRAPNIGELFGPQNQTFFQVDDPCNADEIPDAQDPSVRQSNCNALGSPAGYQSVTDAATLEGVNGGNPDVNAEESDSFTAGIVYSPDFFEGFTMVVDYWEIEITDAISSVAAQDILDRCVDDPGGINNQFCSLITRGSDFEITSIKSIEQNVAAFEAAGVDFELGYTFDALGGTFSTKMIGTKLNKNREFPFQSEPDKPDDERGELGDAEWLANASIRYAGDAINVSWEMRYIDSQLVIENEEFATNPDARDIMFTGSVVYHDVQVKYSVTDDLNVYAGVDNMFDKDIPAFLTGTGQGSSIYDNIGRKFYAGVNFNF